MYCPLYSVILETPEGENLKANFTKLGPFFMGTLDEKDASYLSHRIAYFYMGNKFFNMTVEDADILIQVSCSHTRE